MVDDLEELKQYNVKFLVKMSIVPKHPEDQVKFEFIDTVMKNNVIIHSLPALELTIALPDSYPSN